MELTAAWQRTDEAEAAAAAAAAAARPTWRLAECQTGPPKLTDRYSETASDCSTDELPHSMAKQQISAHAEAASLARHGASMAWRRVRAQVSRCLTVCSRQSDWRGW